jgi:caspase domain-containing protein
MSRYRALLISAGTYQDPKLDQLRSTATDAEALAHVLLDRSISKFEVMQLTDKPAQSIRIALEEFFSDSYNDILLLYFSCHGLKDQDGELVFATTDTQWKNLRATGIEARWIRQLMKDHRRVVLILDCCYSGAFARNMLARGESKVDVIEQLEGRGTYILTASQSMEYAFEGGELQTKDSRHESFFTRAVVEGLRTGKADIDGDGCISVQDLHEYAYDHVKRSVSHQSPTLSVAEGAGKICVAENRLYRVIAGLPPYLRRSVLSTSDYERFQAVDQLSQLLFDPDRRTVASVQATLQYLVDKDDSRLVAGHADDVLHRARTMSQRRRSGPPRYFRRPRWLHFVTVRPRSHETEWIRRVLLHTIPSLIGRFILGVGRVIAELSESNEKKSKPKPPRLPDSEGKRQAVGWLTIIVVLGLILASWLPNNGPKPVDAPRLADENILFEDSLAKTSAVWVHDDMELAGSKGDTRWFEDGTYHMKVSEAGAFLQSPASPKTLKYGVSDVVVQVNAREVSSTGNGLFGIQCRRSAKGYYFLGIASGGRYEISKVTPAGKRVLDSGAYNTTEGSEVYTLQAHCVGGGNGQPLVLVLFVNNQEVGSTTDSIRPVFESGQIGLAIISVDISPLEAEFDNFVVWRP